MSNTEYPSSAQVRQQFLDFFASKDHVIVPSASLAPMDDPTLLFTNAGMNQFKEIFLGLRVPDAPRVADAQKVMRVSGKHNDLDDVGRSPYHHTFFEMLGNWSFGDYYKREAIAWAWELLTKVWGLPKERLWATVFEDDKGNLGQDTEAAGFWHSETDIAPSQVLFFGQKDNFWEMGDTGPCGPCSEIHMDMGLHACDRQDVPGHVCRVNGDCRRYIELWNLVFIQYNRDANGKLTPLPSKHVDTGMGFERIVSVLQNVKTNYDNDLFLPIIRRTQELLGTTDAEREAHIISYRVIADHGRAITFLIGDGVLPSNEGRGYVLRLILRRAARHGRMLGFTEPFLTEVARIVIESMGDHYTELRQRQDFILATIEQEEARFSQTLTAGIAILESLIADLKRRGEQVIPGDEAFRLYDTHGFPLDLTQDMARENDMTVDMDGFKAAMLGQRERGRSSAQFAAGSTEGSQVYLDLLQKLRAAGVVGPAGVAHEYMTDAPQPTTIVGLIAQGATVPSVQIGDPVEVVLPETNFYLESGGQVSDTGKIVSAPDSAAAWEIRVQDVRRPVPGLIVHIGEVIQGTPTVGSPALTAIDRSRRMDVRRNHTATHLLDHELRKILGKHVQQAGSVVAPDRLRFDFTHPVALTQEQLDAIERSINEAVLMDAPVHANQSSYRNAVADGAIALFTEKYGDEVRVVKIGEQGDEYSKELCGGTHVDHTGQIGLFRIVSEESVGAGVRRIEAITGHAALEYARRNLNLLDRIATTLHAPAGEAETVIESLRGELHAAQKEIARLRAQTALGQASGLAQNAVQINGIAVVAAELPDANADTLREVSDRLRGELGASIIVLATVVDGKPQLIVAATDDAVQQGAHAGTLVRAIAKTVGGGGGGKPTLGQAGGRDADKLPEALSRVPDLVRQQLAGQKLD